ncbi:hypothetical protein CY34DRAFT_803123 [Suillus luteus UH-Slu-Lm8-n1]|uniref:Protein kinase domain-containing protein n=1 Tax=Suillus luteus UH-Slu-Lm8-n1 TaxID=930992 RepID=A0A0D0AQT1_9AGAM|nr:hypothetical protein CY34DRAFT_803123 [Suillus luteus UH-Slu-Lm8-n1]
MSFNLTDVHDLTGRVIKTQHITGGSYGDVWKGTYTLIGGRPVTVAMKIINSTAFFDSQSAEQAKRRFLRESRVWSTCIHPHLAQFIGISYEVTQEYQFPCLISLFYENGDIKNYLKHNSNAERMDLVRQFFCGLAYLHGRDIVHGDLKPKNILIDNAGNAVLADFGQSRILGVSGFTTMTVAGTHRYMAPELLIPENPDASPMSTKASDVWAAGMTGLEILSNEIPYVEYNHDNKFVMAVEAKRLPNMEFYPQVPHGTWTAFENGCWKYNPSKRSDVQRLSDYLDKHYGPDSRK